MDNKLFVDTWGWLAILDKKEARHKDVVEYTEIFSKVSGKSFTTDYVLDETITILFKRVYFEKARVAIEKIFDMVANDDLFLIRINVERFQKAWDFRLKYQDKIDISFTDLTSFVVMKEFGIRDVLTDDDHFEKVNLKFKKVP